MNHMSEQPRKLYLDAGKSIGEIFRAHVRWLKASNEKESQFEKPYQDPIYRAMHLKLPEPRWPSIRIPTVNDQILIGTSLATYTIIYPVPTCSLFLGTLDCQEGTDGVGSGRVWLTAPYTEGQFSWDVWEKSGNAEIVVHDSSGINQAISYDVDIIDENADDIEVCGRATFSGGLIGRSEVMGPKGYNIAWLRSEPLPPGFSDPIHAYQSSVLDCGCSVSPSNCVVEYVWDTHYSAESMDADDTALIGVLGGEPPFSWALSNAVDFSLGEATTTARRNTVTSDPGTCELLTVTVTDNDGAEVSGLIYVGPGSWVETSLDPGSCGFYAACQHSAPEYVGECAQYEIFEVCYVIISSTQRYRYHHVYWRPCPGPKCELGCTEATEGCMTPSDYSSRTRFTDTWTC